MSKHLQCVIGTTLVPWTRLVDNIITLNKTTGLVDRIVTSMCHDGFGNHSVSDYRGSSMVDEADCGFKKHFRAFCRSMDDLLRDFGTVFVVQSSRVL